MFISLPKGTGFDEELAVLGAGREFALMKTFSGKVHQTLILFQNKLFLLKENCADKMLSFLLMSLDLLSC